MLKKIISLFHRHAVTEPSVMSNRPRRYQPELPFE